jgi:RNA polymerase sigma-70 factor, ECF subfamily
MVMSEVETNGFEASTAPYRRELLAHCYRMTGSVQEAEDLVQEAYLRAWRAFDRFEQRSSIRTWLYRIATNVCLTALERGRRRPLPSGLGPPSPDPHAQSETAPVDVPWLEPVPDRLVVDEWDDPAEVVAARHSVRLALVAGMQILSPRQRAAFLLCEVLAFPAAQAAELLDSSVGAVKSSLQRARARLADTPVTDEDFAEPTDDGARRVLDRYLAAFEQSDMTAIKDLLADDAVLEMTGSTTWFSGKATCVPFIAAQAIGEAGDWRMFPLRVNGQLGGAAYHRAADGTYHPFAVVVLATTSTHIARIVLFDQPSLFPIFDLQPGRPASP